MAVIEALHVEVDGGTVFCEVAGSGRPVVLSHDGLLHREVWDGQFPLLTDAHRVCRWDRRGYGRSDAGRSAYSSADDLVRVIGQIADGPAVLVGSSSGVLVSLECALDHPELVSALVLAGPVVSGLELSEHFLTRGGRRTDPSPLPAGEEIEFFRTVDPWLIAPANSAARERLAELLTANTQNLEPKPLGREASPALPRLGDISVPTLIIVGEGDIADVHAHAGAIEAGIPGATRVVLPGSGHLPQLEVPEAFNRCLERFLSTLP